ncbi:MAG: hypothetical protein CMF48_00020 [Legionellales bacterium]|nr:hypothetical protein [Legionellales bacterium]
MISKRFAKVLLRVCELVATIFTFWLLLAMFAFAPVPFFESNGLAFGIRLLASASILGWLLSAWSRYEVDKRI